MLFLNITVPVYNEERTVAYAVDRIDKAISGLLRNNDYEIVVVNNGSFDNTFNIANGLSMYFKQVRLLDLKEKGRGLAIKTAWLQSEASILSYMDSDLSTDLEAFPRLIYPLVNNQFDIVIGSRLKRDSITFRSLKRELISRCYNIFIRKLFAVGISDAQCGFKAIRREIAHKLIPAIKDNRWFFDTELLLLALHCGLRVREIPVIWKESGHSKVELIKTIIEDLKGLVRVRRSLRGSSRLSFPS